MRKYIFPCIRFTFLGAILITVSFADGSGESILTLFSALLHELGHIILMLVLGIGIRGLTVTPLGFEIDPKREYKSFYEEIAVSLAGCAVNLLTFFMFFGTGGLLQVLAETSLLLGIMNIMPVRCLDGGEALNAFLNLFLLPDKAERVGRAISFAALIFMWIPAVYIFLATGYNYSLFIMSTWLFCRIFFQ